MFLRQGLWLTVGGAIARLVVAFLAVRLLSSLLYGVFFFASRRRHTISLCDWSSDVCSSDLFLGLDGWQSAVCGCQGGACYCAADPHDACLRSEDRRVGKKCRSRGSADH